MPKPRLPGSKAKVNRLERVLQGRRRAAILLHDNPDPDALAGMMGLRSLLTRHFKIKVRLTYGGEIGRAENQAMVRVLPFLQRNRHSESRMSPSRVRQSAATSL